MFGSCLMYRNMLVWQWPTFWCACAVTSLALNNRCQDTAVSALTQMSIKNRKRFFKTDWNARTLFMLVSRPDSNCKVAAIDELIISMSFFAAESGQSLNMQLKEFVPVHVYINHAEGTWLLSPKKLLQVWIWFHSLSFCPTKRLDQIRSCWIWIHNSLRMTQTRHMYIHKSGSQWIIPQVGPEWDKAA